MSIMSKLFCRDDIGIDLGAANMRVWIRGEGLVLDEPSAVAFSTLYESKPRVLAVGAEALKLVEGKDNVAEQGTGLPVRAADDPEHATIRGVGVVLDKLDYLSKHAKK